MRCFRTQPHSSSILRRRSFSPPLSKISIWFIYEWRLGSTPIFVGYLLVSSLTAAMDDKCNTCAPIGHVAQLPEREKAGGDAPRSLASVARHVGGACLHVLASPGAGTLVFASVCLVLAYKHKKGRLMASSTAVAATIPEAPQIPPTPVLYRSVSFGMLYGGENAMQRIMHAHEARLDSTKLNKAVDDLRAELAKERKDYSKLNVLAASLEMSGKEKEAIKIFEAALQKSAKNEQEMHELQMLLVEMLIYQGDYVKAFGYASLCSEDTSVADPRVPLYKAAIFAMMGKEYRAKECYETFKEIQKDYNRPKFFKGGSTVHVVVPEFDQFMTIVNNIKKEIKDAHATITGASKSNQGTQQAQPGGTAVDPAKATPQAPQRGTATDRGTQQQAQQGGTLQVGSQQTKQEGTATDQGTQQQAQQGGTQQTKQEGTATDQGTRQQTQQGGTQQTKQEGTATDQGTRQQTQQGGTQQTKQAATNQGTQQGGPAADQGTQQTEQEGTAATNQGTQQRGTTAT
ncbi:hypothetical protein BHM03_00020187 [Ensete ventricosum]|uniref:Uncharacterized protein n=1 Tax=Ensete ventricosum TaxID=4639 RepID=A0A445MFV6_ENSVE|nr:hypothetical protein BHM03_00020187 [Ensete ventricosum]